MRLRPSRCSICGCRTCPIEQKASSNACCRWQRTYVPARAQPQYSCAVNVFLLFSAYYTIRPLRSALLLPVQISLCQAAG